MVPLCSLMVLWMDPGSRILKVFYVEYFPDVVWIDRAMPLPLTSQSREHFTNLFVNFSQKHLHRKSGISINMVCLGEKKSLYLTISWVCANFHIRRLNNENSDWSASYNSSWVPANWHTDDAARVKPLIYFNYTLISGPVSENKCHSILVTW